MRVTKPKKVIPKGSDWVLVTSSNAFIQNTDDEPIIFAFSPSKPTIRAEDGHKFKQEQDDHYVNESPDSLWVMAEPHKTLILTITEW